MVDNKTARELYFPPFEAAIEAGVGGAMCSYNKVRVKSSGCSFLEGIISMANILMYNDHNCIIFNICFGFYSTDFVLICPGMFGVRSGGAAGP